MMNQKNFVVKRNGKKEQVHFDKITSRIQKLCYGLNMDYVDPVSITLKVISGLYPGVTTAELDNLAAETAVVMTSQHPDYAVLAARIAISNVHKETKKHFSDVIEDLHKATKTPIISNENYSIIMKNASRLNSCIIYDRDFSYNYFAFKLLERTCLLKINGKTVERPQHMLMRVAVGIHGEDIDSAIETYNYISEKYFLHDLATLTSAATTEPDLFSSYLISMPDDSLDGIYDCIMRCAIVGNTGADIGISIQNIRAKGTEIAGTNGVSNGLVPMLRVFNNSACYVSQNERVESQAIYLEPWHADILEFLNLKKGSGKDEYRARDLMYALWIPDLFMKRVKNNEKWSLMCPHRSQDLPNTWGEEFEKLYEKYEAEGNFTKQIQARDLWKAICVSQMESGTPYILYKDACNKKSNQQSLGTIRNGSYCTGLVQYTSPDEIPACASASIAVNMFINSDKSYYDFEKLKQATKTLTKNLNRIIDVSSYPLPQARESNLCHRPIQIGVQGLADTFILLRMPFDSQEARLLNKQIFETIYYGALEASSELAEKYGTYNSYEGSPVSKGVLQYNMWNVTPTDLWNWSSLKERIAKYGIRNSLLTAITPSTATSQILGNNRSTEPYISNIYVGRVPSGEFQVINPLLLKDLIDRDLWNDTIKDQIIDNDGSIQTLPSVPEDLKKIYKTVWEISQKVIIDMAADRGAYIDQSQSMNLYISAPNYAVLTSMHTYGWQKGLKTGIYTLTTRAKANNIHLKGDGVKTMPLIENGVKGADVEGKSTEEEAALVCSLQNPGACEMCSA